MVISLLTFSIIMLFRSAWVILVHKYVLICRTILNGRLLTAWITSITEMSLGTFVRIFHQLADFRFYIQCIIHYFA